MSKTTTTPAVTVKSLIAVHEGTPGPKRRTLRDSWMKAGMDAAMSGDLSLAKVYATAVDAAKSAKSTGTAVEVDWRSITIDRIAALRLAADYLESGHVRPSGTPADADLDDLDLDKGTEHNVSEAAIRLAGVRLAGQRNVPEFIAERVADLGTGWHTASDLAKGQIDAPSTGAIGAVWAKMSDARAFVIDGIEAGRTEKGVSAFRAA